MATKTERKRTTGLCKGARWSPLSCVVEKRVYRALLQYSQTEKEKERGMERAREETRSEKESAALRLSETLDFAMNHQGIENSEEMFAAVCSKMAELENAIASFNDFLKQQEMYSYVHGIVQKFFKLSNEMKSRMHDISTLYSFLVRDRC